MKTTKRIISSSVFKSATYQQIMADKQARRERCAKAIPASGTIQYAV